MISFSKIDMHTARARSRFLYPVSKERLRYEGGSNGLMVFFRPVFGSIDGDILLFDGTIPDLYKVVGDGNFRADSLELR